MEHSGVGDKNTTSEPYWRSGENESNPPALIDPETQELQASLPLDPKIPMNIERISQDAEVEEHRGTGMFGLQKRGSTEKKSPEVAERTTRGHAHSEDRDRQNLVELVALRKQAETARLMEVRAHFPTPVKTEGDISEFQSQCELKAHSQRMSEQAKAREERARARAQAKQEKKAKTQNTVQQQKSTEQLTKKERRRERLLARQKKEKEEKAELERLRQCERELMTLRASQGRTPGLNGNNAAQWSRINLLQRAREEQGIRKESSNPVSTNFADANTFPSVKEAQAPENPSLAQDDAPRTTHEMPTTAALPCRPPRVESEDEDTKFGFELTVDLRVCIRTLLMKT